MDKKNTMLLTVIAVATLLVAVVGATFAYFTATGSDNSTTAAVDLQADKAGTVALDGGGSLGLYVTAAEMASAVKGTDYYAVQEFNAETNPHNGQTADYITIASATVTGGEDDTVYYCEFDIDVTKSGTMLEGEKPIVADDASVYFRVGDAVTSETITEGKVANTAVAATYHVEFEITGAGTSETLVEVAAAVHNTADGSQADRMAGKTLGFDFDVKEGSFACDTAQ